MVESGERKLEASTLVLDPQQPRELRGVDLTGLTTRRLAVVLNRNEAAAASGKAEPADAAAAVAEMTGAEVVVVKLAARGALVHSSEGQEVVAARETSTVWPIGSGDVFAAAFTWAWGVTGQGPVEAAQIGSLAAAHWCGGHGLPFPSNIQGLAEKLPAVEPARSRVYLAAPFFTLAQQWLVEVCKNALEALGAEVFSPLHDVGTGGPGVAQLDLDGLASCSSVLALLDESDPGTWIEVGWARNANKPVIGYCEPQAEEQMKMAIGTGVEMHNDLSTAVYHAIWAGMVGN
jgi:hypothetical protein